LSAGRYSDKYLFDFAKRVMLSLGVSEPDSDRFADVLITADLRGIASHGIGRLSRYVDGIRSGKIDPRAHPSVLVSTPTVSVISGGNGLGQVAANFAMEQAIEKARVSGVGLSFVRDSNHFGIAGYYAMKPLSEGMIGICMTNARPLVVHTFSRRAVLGTNPISVAVPTGWRYPFVLDMATSVITSGRVEVYERLSRVMPVGWCVDADGRPAVDPAFVLDSIRSRRQGGLLPLGGDKEELGGHKGYGLAMLVDILSGVLSGAAFGLDVGSPDSSHHNVGHFLAALDIRMIMPVDEFKSRMRRLIDMLKNSPRQVGAGRIYIHGEKEFEEAEKRAIEGILLPEKVVKTLVSIGESVGVPFEVG